MVFEVKTPVQVPVAPPTSAVHVTDAEFDGHVVAASATSSFVKTLSGSGTATATSAIPTDKARTRRRRENIPQVLDDTARCRSNATQFVRLFFSL